MKQDSSSQAGGCRREHGVIGEYSTRVVGMDPACSSQVVREAEDLRYPLLASSLVPPVCRVTVGNEPIGTLDNGLGANWSPAGQGEEAFPDDGDEAGWERVFDAMTTAGIKWVRYHLDPIGLVQAGRVVAEHRLFRRLDRLQRWAAGQDATIMAELMMVPREFQRDEVYDAPGDNRAYVCDYILPLMRHVLRERRCDRIRQLCLFNEPFNPDVAPYIFFPPPGRDPIEYYLELHEILRAELDAAGLTDVGLIGPNSADMFQRLIEMFEDKGLAERVARTFAELDVHQWRLRFDYYPASKRWPGYPMSEGIARYLQPTLAAARRMGKRLSLTETGAMYFNEHPCTSRNTQHDAFLAVAEGIVRSVNAGVAGAMVWAFTNSGRIDGQWGWVGTRARRFEPVPNLLNGYTVLMKHQRVGAAIHPCTVAASDFSSFISAGCLVAPGAGETIWLVNDHPVEKTRVELTLPIARSGRPLAVLRKGFEPEVQRLEPIASADRIALVLPGMSLTTLATE
jgi:hypothetical protein